MKSFRVQDMKAEQKLGEFMDAYFYSKLKSKNGSALKCTRIHGRESQVKGIDICIETEGRRMLIDEKASLYYSNAMIPTFAFEIDWMHKGVIEPMQGWFVNDRLRTDYYMLIWPNVKCIQRGGQWVRKEIRELGKDDFTIIEAMLIEKSDIRAMLAEKGFTAGYLLEYARKLRQRNRNGDSREEEELADNVKITFSGQLAEKPINVVIRKELLRDLAKGIYLISSDGYATLKG